MSSRSTRTPCPRRDRRRRAVPQDAARSPGRRPVRGGVGLAGTKIVNFFLGEGERNVTVLLRPARCSRLVSGLNFGLLLALAAIGLALDLRHHGPLELRARRDGHLRRPSRWSRSSFWRPGSRCGSAIAAAVCSAAACSAGPWMPVLWRPLRHRGVGVVQLMIVEHRPLARAALRLPVLHRRRHAASCPAPSRGADPALRRRSQLVVDIDVARDGRQHRRHRRRSRWCLTPPADRQGHAGDLRQPAAGRGIRHRRRRGGPRTCGSSPARSPRLAGILWAYFRPGVKWDMGAQILLLIFAAVTLGGLGTAFGALVGALIVGIAGRGLEHSGSPPTSSTRAHSFVLIVILLFRPQGMLGRREGIG